ncbi:MAG: hypothetical protein D8M58_00465 [Calditrichaeota bacterium]|nr:MAG: hypothetical protein DWQ03_06615 [Calditrichota bacterium]MBL1203843.1 hypothetical protein [Calditrichota bacterium]NOG43675.1 hypothetical protein [Calditrichota bacterium]
MLHSFRLFFLALIFTTNSVQAHINTTLEKSTPQSKVAFSLSIVNDNYIGTWKKGVKNNYFGADDFLTVSLLARLYVNNWNTALVYQSITSRKFNFRYDLLSGLVSKKVHAKWVDLQSQAGIVLKGDFGGATLQNNYHTLRYIKTIDFPYSKEKGIAFIIGFNAIWQKKHLLFSRDLLKANFEARFITDFVPSRIGPSISYQNEIFSFIQMELLALGRFYVIEKKEYSEMIRSGLISAINLKFKTYQQFYFDIGFAIFPTKNLLNAPRFPKYEHSYLPQFWLSFSWNSSWQSLRDYIDY